MWWGMDEIEMVRWKGGWGGGTKHERCGRTSITPQIKQTTRTARHKASIKYYKMKN